MYQLNPLCLESTVARRLVDSGTITDPKTIKMMIRKGWIPTKKKTTRGLRRSAINTAKKNGFKISTRNNIGVNSFTMPKGISKEVAATQSAMFDTNLKPGSMSIPHDPSRYRVKKAINADGVHMTPMQSSIISWHEGREAARSSSPTGKKWINHQLNLMSKVKEILEKDPSLLNQLNQTANSNVTNYGAHMPGVMRDEYKLANMLKRRYGFDLQNDIMKVPLPKNLAVDSSMPFHPNGAMRRMPGELELGKMTAKQDLNFRKSTNPLKQIKKV